MFRLLRQLPAGYAGPCRFSPRPDLTHRRRGTSEVLSLQKHPPSETPKSRRKRKIRLFDFRRVCPRASRIGADHDKQKLCAPPKENGLRFFSPPTFENAYFSFVSPPRPAPLQRKTTKGTEGTRLSSPSLPLPEAHFGGKTAARNTRKQKRSSPLAKASFPLHKNPSMQVLSARNAVKLLSCRQQFFICKKSQEEELFRFLFCSKKPLSPFGNSGFLFYSIPLSSVSPTPRCKHGRRWQGWIFCAKPE